MSDSETIRLLREQVTELVHLAGELAHEIKNPLSVIGLNMDLLAEDLALVNDPNVRRGLQKVRIVKAQCERLQKLLDDFLRFSRVRQLDLVPGNLNDEIERVLDLFEAGARESGIQITRYLDADLPGIQLDHQSLQAALVNLVKNALEAMPDGGELTVRTRPTLAGVSLDLIDTGPGIEPHAAVRMFEPFYSTKQGGSGLGLPTAQKIIEAHDGAIDVQSALGRGTQFTLTFPVPVRLGGTT